MPADVRIARISAEPLDLQEHLDAVDDATAGAVTTFVGRVRDHDPDLALYGGGVDGLEIPRAVVMAARRLLRPGGVFVMEHAEVQAEAVREIVSGAGFLEVSSFEDLTHRPRGVRAIAP